MNNRDPSLHWALLSMNLNLSTLNLNQIHSQSHDFTIILTCKPSMFSWFHKQKNSYANSLRIVSLNKAIAISLWLWNDSKGVWAVLILLITWSFSMSYRGVTVIHLFEIGMSGWRICLFSLHSDRVVCGTGSFICLILPGSLPNFCWINLEWSNLPSNSLLYRIPLFLLLSEWRIQLFITLDTTSQSCKSAQIRKIRNISFACEIIFALFLFRIPLFALLSIILTPSHGILAVSLCDFCRRNP